MVHEFTGQCSVGELSSLVGQVQLMYLYSIPNAGGIFLSVADNLDEYFVRFSQGFCWCCQNVTRTHETSVTILMVDNISCM